MLPLAIGKILLQTIGPALVKEVGAAIAASPEAKNELNQENPLRSRVVTGASLGLVGSLGIVLTQAATYGTDVAGYDMEVFVPAVMVLLANAYTLWGRLASGLKPMWTRIVQD